MDKKYFVIVRKVFILLAAVLCLYSTAEAQVKKYTYDVLGRLVLVEDVVNGTRQYNYDAAGNRTLVAVSSLSTSSVSSASSTSVISSRSSSSFSSLSSSPSSSASSSSTPMLVVATPAISPNGGNYINSVSVTISSATTDAIIHYTTDGTPVTLASPTYSGAITLTASATVKAKAFKAGMTDSTESSVLFTVAAAAPSISPAGGSFVGSVNITLSTSTPSATIRYTTDGSPVTPSSPSYSGAFTLTTSAIVKAKTFKAGMADSAESSNTYTVVVATPAISPNGGSYVGSASVTLSTATSGATIRYTTDGSAVTPGSLSYSGAILVTTNTTIKSKAFKNGMADSGESSAYFSVAAYTPSFSPNAGTYTGSVSVSLNSSTIGATIRYTTDNSTVTSSSAVYSGVLTFTSSLNLRVKAFANGMAESGEASAYYAINSFPAPTGLNSTQTAPYTYSTRWDPVSGATFYNFRTADGVISKETGTSKIVSYTTPDWVQACNDYACGPKNYFSNIALAVDAPSISPNGGSYTSSVSVSLSTTTSGATIRYTTDGSSVGSGSAAYSGALTFTTNTVLKVKAFKAGLNDSSEVSASFSVSQPAVVAPAFSPNGGTFYGSVAVGLSTSTSGATIRYTTDNTSVTSNSAVYSGLINLTGSATIKAKAFNAGMPDSSETSAFFSVTPFPAPTIYTPIQYAPYSWRVKWDPVTNATYYNLRNKAGTIIQVYGTTYDLSNATPDWVQACNAQACGAKAYF